MRRLRWIDHELLRLWRKAFGQPPVLMGDPRLMIELLRAARAERLPDPKQRDAA